MKYAGTIIRMLLGCALLWEVWHHAHWSVALSLTLIGITVELTGYAVLMHGNALRRVGISTKPWPKPED